MISAYFSMLDSGLSITDPTWTVVQHPDTASSGRPVHRIGFDFNCPPNPDSGFYEVYVGNRDVRPGDSIVLEDDFEAGMTFRGRVRALVAIVEPEDDPTVDHDDE